MQFILATPEQTTKILTDASKVRAQLSTGSVEIYDKHQDLIGKVGIDIIEVESAVDNKILKIKYLIQQGVVIVSNKGINSETIPLPPPDTAVYIYAKRILELNSSNINIAQYNQKIETLTITIDKLNAALSEEIAKEAAKVTTKDKEIKVIVVTEKIRSLKTKLALFEEEREFAKKVISLVKDTKN
jgi:hypothetical protein